MNDTPFLWSGRTFHGLDQLLLTTSMPGGWWEMEWPSDHKEQSDWEIGELFDNWGGVMMQILKCLSLQQRLQATVKNPRNMVLRGVMSRKWWAQKDHFSKANSQRKFYLGPQIGCFQETDRRVFEYVVEKRIKGMPSLDWKPWRSLQRLSVWWFWTEGSQNELLAISINLPQIF